MHRIRPLRTALTRTRAYSSFQNRPAPPKLPASEQAEFERLQREAAVSSAFQPGNTVAPKESGLAQHQTQTRASASANADVVIEEGAHPALFRGAPPEFEGDKNPVTGEVGGPKTEPLRWGGHGDWSYNGRVTDF
ncbi:putative mitochondrial protein, conserved [Metarhizium rileyi]|uniref:Succinate dehydrogenase assembly factor 4, mitochondrial n=1 Tax=Metarhizium rileyi (strain RCEF 4871) TaxID=1649241 RepID=A0A5C6G874_METRR|nr:putative mitochondrial protein, conserved [Metarhizium rileyi]